MRGKIKKIVKKLIKKYGTNNPFEICDALGIWVYKVELGSLKGHHIYEKRKKVIFLNENLSYVESFFACAHELGHALLHKGHNKYFNLECTFQVTEKHEIEAHRFALDLILTSERLSEFEGCTLEQMSKSLEIDINILKLKF
jgi:Zn-dependent peptidase ImmA (M78 family)